MTANMKSFLTFSISLFMCLIANSQFVNYRQLLIFGSETTPALVTKQKDLLYNVKAGVLERDIKITVVPAASELNKKYKVKPNAFEVVLVGKDGGEKHRSTAVLKPQELFAIIDAMPMRRSEMKKNE